MIEHLKEKIKRINSKYPNINYGGCGTFSYHLHKVLKDKYDINTEIVYIPASKPPGKRPDYDVSFQHILIKYDNFYIDNNGIYPINEYSLRVEDLSINKLEEMVNTPELWNNKFDVHVYNQNFEVESISDRMVADIYEI